MKTMSGSEKALLPRNIPDRDRRQKVADRQSEHSSGQVEDDPVLVIGADCGLMNSVGAGIDILPAIYRDLVVSPLIVGSSIAAGLFVNGEREARPAPMATPGP